MFGAPDSLLISAQVLWITLALLTLAKFVTNFAFVVREWRDPVRVYFFNMMNVSLFIGRAGPRALARPARAGIRLGRRENGGARRPLRRGRRSNYSSIVAVIIINK